MKLGVSYFGNRWLDHARADLEEIRARRCDWVLHTFDETDLRFNRGNLKALCALSHGLGLQVYFSPWAIGGVFGGEAVSAFGARHPEACQVLNTGERTPHACPAHPRFRAFMREWIEAAAAAGADVILWDEPHLWRAAWEGRRERPGVYSVGSDHARLAWRKLKGKALSSRRGPEVDAFREWMVFDFLRWATRLAKRIQPRLRNAVCMPADGASPSIPALWDRLAALDSVDIFSTDPYWKAAPTSNPSKIPLKGFVDVHARRLAALGARHGKETLIWLQLFALRRQEHGDVDRALAMFEKAGLDNIGAWGYRGTGAYSDIACQDAGVLWERVGRQFQRLKRKP